MAAYMTAGVFLSCMLFVLPFGGGALELEFTLYGSLGGVLLVCANSCAFLAASLVGLSTGQGVWSGTAILVSFLWGTLGPDPLSAPVRSVGLSLVALVVLLLGVGLVVSCRTIATALVGRSTTDRALVEPGDGNAAVEVSAGSDDATATSGPSASPPSARGVGLTFALLVGAFGGSILAPLAFTGDKFQGGSNALRVLPSFGIGAAAAGSVLTGVWYSAARSRARKAGADPPPLKMPETLWAGMLSGVVWNAGNVCQLIAMNVCDLPYGVAYPLLQTSLVVAGILGIFAFGELRGRAPIALFFTGAAFVVVGAILLGTYGPSPTVETVPPSPLAPPALPPPPADSPPPSTPPVPPLMPTSPPPAGHELLEMGKRMWMIVALHLIGCAQPCLAGLSPAPHSPTSPEHPPEQPPEQPLELPSCLQTSSSRPRCLAMLRSRAGFSCSA